MHNHSLQSGVLSHLGQSPCAQFMYVCQGIDFLVIQIFSNGGVLRTVSRSSIPPHPCTATTPLG